MVPMPKLILMSPILAQDIIRLNCTSTGQSNLKNEDEQLQNRLRPVALAQTGGYMI